MSGRVCYLARSDRGARLVAVRLVGEHADDVWLAPDARDDAAPSPADDAAAAAAWVAERLAAAGAASLALLCLDVDGATCSWLTAPSTDPAVLAAAAAQRENAAADASAASLSAPVALTEASIQALADDEPPAPAAGLRRVLPGRERAEHANGAGRRLAILAVPDVIARLFIDALDERGIAVDAAASLWHAMALAWDPAGPSAPGAAARADRVVASSAGVTAVVLIDPAGRLVWSWSHAGELLAGGAVRLLPAHAAATADLREGALARRADDAPPAPPAVTPADISRLTTDWLAWSAQLGHVPSRILCIGPPVESDGEALGPAELGEALGRAWEGVTIDLGVHDDPVGATLARAARLPAGAAAPADDPRAGLLALGRRPGRAHRALHQWGAAAVLAAALVLFVIGWNAWEQADDAQGRRVRYEQQANALVAEVVPNAANNPLAPRMLKDMLDKLKNDRGEAGRRPAKPILSELETVSVVLASMPGALIEDMYLRDDSVMVKLSVPDTRTAELILESLSSIEGSNVDWKGSFDSRSSRAGDRHIYTLLGAWRTAPAPGGTRVSGGAR